MSKKIWEPMEIGGIRTKNRIVLPPMCTRLANPDGSVTPRLIDYYEARARGGVGMVIVEYSYIDDIASKAAACQLGVYHDDLIPGLNDLVERLQHYGTRVFLQICHGGGQSPSSLIQHEPVAPSPVPSKTGEVPRELTVEEIRNVAEAFGRAALRAQRAGFDGVEIHAAHGYLINQFLSPHYNRRTDAYGLDFPSRTRFPLEVLSEIRQKVGSRFPVGVRLNVKDYVPGGVEVDETLELIKMLEKNGTDYIHASAGTYLSHQYMISPPYIERGHLEGLAKKCKRAVTIPIIAVGGINQDIGVRILENDSAHLVAMGRALVADPELPLKLSEKREGDIRPCIRCNTGCIGRFFEGKTMRCATNPAAGREKDSILETARTPGNVVIIGAGVAGMEAARIAKQRGHRVTILEKGKSLGGNVSVASVPAFKTDLTRLLDWYKRQMRQLRIDIKFNVNATPVSVKRLKPDVLLIAAGAEYCLPEIDGIRKEGVMTASDVLLRRKKIGQRVVIIGGGLIGIETALHIHHTSPGKKITVIELLAEPLWNVVRVNKLGILEKLQTTDIKVITSADIRRITKAEVEYFDGDHRPRTLPSDTVVLAAGFSPRTGYEELFTGVAPKIYTIGDCRKPGPIIDAIGHAARVASRI